MSLGLRLGLRIGSGGFAPLPALDYLLLLGSSTTAQAFTNNPNLGRQEQAARAAFVAEGVDIPIVCKAVSGSTLANLDSNVTSYVTDFTFTGKNVGVLVHIGSNDIGATTYAAMLQATKDAMLAALLSIVTKIEAAGANFYPMVATSNSLRLTEDLYQDWATFFYDPVVDARTPRFKIAGAPAFDYSELYSVNRAVTNWWNADDVHPWQATPVIHSYTVQRLKQVATLPAIAAKESFLIFFKGSAAYIGGVNCVVGGAGTQTVNTIVNNRGAVVAGVSYSYAGSSGVGSTVRAGVGNRDIDISNVDAQTHYLYSSPGSHTHTFTGGAAYANRTGTAYMTFNTSYASRKSRFTIGGSSADITGNAAGLQVVSVPFTADGSGVVTMTVSPASGTYPSINGWQLEFD